MVHATFANIVSADMQVQEFPVVRKVDAAVGLDGGDEVVKLVLKVHCHGTCLTRVEIVLAVVLMERASNAVAYFEEVVTPRRSFVKTVVTKQIRERHFARVPTRGVANPAIFIKVFNDQDGAVCEILGAKPGRNTVPESEKNLDIVGAQITNIAWWGGAWVEFWARRDVAGSEGSD
jgi:hypothetical protein